MGKEEKMSGPLITLNLDVGERSFFNIDELSEWHRNEVNAFNWITIATKNDSIAESGWKSIRGWLGEVGNFIKQYSQYEGNEQQRQQLISNLVRQTDDTVSKGRIITSSSPHAKFVFDLKENNSEIIAAYALNYLLNIDSINFNSKNALHGSFSALQYLYGNSETVESNRNSLEELRQDWDNKFTTQYSNQREKNTELIDEFESFKSTFSLIQSEIAKTKNSQIDDFKKILEKAEGRLGNIEQTYDNKLSLQSSVNYWTQKRRHHQIVLFALGSATLVFSIVTGATFIWAAHELLKETLPNVHLWKLGVVFAISTFGIWLTRLSAKIFISNLHLRTDADERVTMIQTYLAMLREGNGPKDDERQLILQTLFRPSNSGFIKEDGNAGFQESIVKLFQQR